MGAGFLNPMASGQSTGAMKALMSKAYGRKGGKRSARRRKRSAAPGSGGARRRRRAGARKSSGRRLKFGSPAWRKKYLRKKKR